VKFDRRAAGIGCALGLVVAAFFAMLVAFLRNWPANSSEWASWVQAWGAIAAIAAAVALPRIDAWNRKRQVERRAYVYVTSLSSSLRDLIEKCEKNDKEGGDECMWRIDEALVSARSIPLEFLDAERSIRVAACIALTRQVVEMWKLMGTIKSPSPVYFAAAKAELERIKKHVVRHGAAMTTTSLSDWFRRNSLQDQASV